MSSIDSLLIRFDHRKVMTDTDHIEYLYWNMCAGLFVLVSSQ